MNNLENIINSTCQFDVKKKKLGEVVKFINGRAYKKQELLEQGKYPVLRVGNFFTSDKWYYSDLELEEDKYCNTGDLLYAWSASLGPKIWDGGKVIFHYHIWKLEFDEKVLNKQYLYHFLKDDVNEIYGSLTHSTMLHVSMANMKEREIVIPSLEKQVEIVRILDELENAIDSLNERLLQEIELRKKQYDIYAAELICGEYQQEQLSDLASFTYGYTDKAKDSGDFRFIRITDIDENGMLKTEDAKYITSSKDAERYLLNKDDLVMARTGATYGKTLLIQENMSAVYASFLIKISLDKNVINPRFYWYFTRTHLYWDQANKYVSTGGQPQFNSRAVGKVKIPIPPLDIQKKICDMLDIFDLQTRQIVFLLSKEIEERKEQFVYYRKQLLISGGYKVED